MAQETPETGPIKSLDTAMTILEQLRAADGCKMSMIAKELGVSTSTAHRYLKTLEQKEYVIKDGAEYKIGLRFMQYGLQAKHRYQGVEMIQQKVEELATDTGERAQFMLPEHGKAICMCHSMGERAVNLKMDVGERVPLHAISTGKAMLAERSDDEIEEYYLTHGLADLTEDTITDLNQLMAEIRTIRERGYSTNNSEYMDGISAAAVPVHYPDGEVYGAVGLAGPPHRMTEDRIEADLADLLRGTASEIRLNIEYTD
jgi:DNA-binding IclR family transcriptional regulator